MNERMNVLFQNPTKLDAEPAERGIDLRTYLNFLWRHWMFIGAVAALALLVGFIYLARATPIYTATAQILLDPTARKSCRRDAGLSDLRVRLFFHGEPANHHQIGPAAAARGHQGAARAAAAGNSKCIAELARRPPTRMQNQRKPNASKMP